MRQLRDRRNFAAPEPCVEALGPLLDRVEGLNYWVLGEGLGRGEQPRARRDGSNSPQRRGRRQQ